ncbi:MAG: hypothetical protein Q8N51_19055, partial [Gammaproteobacteria bacterium]|nr:hypothetical protein [Gammaproteobacteria bacterium]
EAIVSETPAALLNLVGAGRPTAPYILSNLLHRYPQRESGLSLWDRMLLERASTKGPNAASVIGWVLCDTWDNGDGVGEPYLFHRLKKMAGVQNPEPLLILSGNSENCRGAEVALTEFGRAVLDGRASAYPTNPIDEWIGGVHVSSATGNIWMSDGDTVRKAPAN